MPRPEPQVFTTANLQHPEKYVGKQKDNIVCRSSWERSFVMDYLDRNSNILEWSSEEIVIPYINRQDKRTHRYFPDYYMKFKAKNGQIQEALIEIKPDHEAQDQPKLTEGMSRNSKIRVVGTFLINQDKWEAARKFCEKRGWKFVVITEKDVCFFKQK